jgi:hypothetical protein
MENFFYDDKFYYELSDYLDDIEIEELDDFNNLDDDFSIKIEHSEIQPVFQITPSYLLEMLMDCNEDRIDENFDDRHEKKIIEALNECIDFDKLKKELPQYYYGNGDFEIITKQDLIDYFNN